MGELEGLLERVEAASGAGREIDTAVWVATIPDWRVWSGHIVCPADEPDHWAFTPDQQVAFLAAAEALPRPRSEGWEDRLCKAHATPYYTSAHDPLTLYDGRFSSSTKNLNRRAVPQITASLDAAIALVERVLPGACWRIEKNTPAWLLAGHRPFWATCGIPGAQEDAAGETAPLSVLAALLKALIARGDGHG